MSHATGAQTLAPALGMCGATSAWRELFNFAVTVFATSMAMIGAFGWAEKARLLEALQTPHPPFAAFISALDPLWPLYGLAGIACLASQVLAAGAVVLLAAGGLRRPLRWVAVGFYLAGAIFAGYSAEQGASVVLDAPHRAVIADRDHAREELRAEVRDLQARIDAERARLPDPRLTVTSRQEQARLVFETATAASRARLAAAQDGLRTLQAPLEVVPLDGEHTLVFALFLGWALLEPWGFALTAARETADERPRRAGAPGTVQGSLMRRAANFAGHLSVRRIATSVLASLPLAPAPAAADATQTMHAMHDVAFEPDGPDASREFASQAARKAFALANRERLKVPDIAAVVGVHASTVYRWYEAADSKIR